jgi:hypothetical protein
MFCVCCVKIEVELLTTIQFMKWKRDSAREMDASLANENVVATEYAGGDDTSRWSEDLG